MHLTKGGSRFCVEHHNDTSLSNNLVSSLSREKKKGTKSSWLGGRLTSLMGHLLCWPQLTLLWMIIWAHSWLCPCAQHACCLVGFGAEAPRKFGVMSCNHYTVIVKLVPAAKPQPQPQILYSISATNFIPSPVILFQRFLHSVGYL